MKGWMEEGFEVVMKQRLSTCSMKLNWRTRAVTQKASGQAFHNNNKNQLTVSLLSLTIELLFPTQG